MCFQAKYKTWTINMSSNLLKGINLFISSIGSGSLVLKYILKQKHNACYLFFSQNSCLFCFLEFLDSVIC